MGLLDTSRHSKPLAKIPATKYQSKFVALIKALIEEGFVFSPENIETIVHQEDDDAEDLLAQYPSGQKFLDTFVEIWDEGGDYDLA